MGQDDTYTHIFLVRLTVVLHAREHGVLVIYIRVEKTEMFKICDLHLYSLNHRGTVNSLIAFLREAPYPSTLVMIDLMVTCWSTSRNTSSSYFATPLLTPNLLLHQMDIP